MKLIHVANKYCRESDWKVLLLLKICLLSAGMIAGMLRAVKGKHKKRAARRIPASLLWRHLDK